MKISESIGILGFLLAIITVILTRFERRKKLTIDLYCKRLQDLESNNQFVSEKGERNSRDVCID